MSEMLGRFLNAIPLLRVWTLPLAVVLALLFCGVLWWKGARHCTRRTRVMLVMGAILIAGGCWLGIDVLWHPFAEGIGRFTWAWVGVFLFGLFLAGATLSQRRQRRPSAIVGTVMSLVMVLVSSFLAINGHYGAYPSVGSLVNAGITTVPWTQLSLPDPSHTLPPSTGILEDEWRAEGEIPDSGVIAETPIPASHADFSPRNALVYLPPAYFASNRPALPVLVLVTGQPGSPMEWLSLGNIGEALNSYARAHNGIAPIVAMVDILSTPIDNPLCSDGAKGHVATYVEQDVPLWLKQNLGVHPDPDRWAIGGYSSGGTCALQTVTRAPEVYRSFLDMSGEEHPTLGNEEQTIRQIFGGQREKYAANDPMSLMQKNSYPMIHGIFSAGKGDHLFGPYMETLSAQAEKAGMTVEKRLYPGGHTWRVWSAAVNDQLPWVGQRLGISREGRE